MKKKIDSPICPFCPDTEQSITHLFVHCSLAVSIWNEFTKWYRSLCKKHSAPVLTEYEILYGVLKGSSSLQTLNHLILMGKYFLFICAKNNKKYINLRILSFPCKNKWSWKNVLPYVRTNSLTCEMERFYVEVNIYYTISNLC